MFSYVLVQVLISSCPCDCAVVSSSSVRVVTLMVLISSVFSLRGEFEL